MSVETGEASLCSLMCPSFVALLETSEPSNEAMIGLVVSGETVCDLILEGRGITKENGLNLEA